MTCVVSFHTVFRYVYKALAANSGGLRLTQILGFLISCHFAWEDCTQCHPPRLFVQALNNPYNYPVISIASAAYQAGLPSRPDN